MDKVAFISHCEQVLQEKYRSLTMEAGALEHSLHSESKSSAGDKHETGRAMVHLEMEKLGKQIQEAKRQINKLRQLSKERSIKIKEGCLVRSDSGWFFLGIALGKVFFQNEAIFCLSTASPLGQQLLDQEEGSEIIMNKRVIMIIEIL